MITYAYPELMENTRISLSKGTIYGQFEILIYELALVNKKRENTS